MKLYGIFFNCTNSKFLGLNVIESDFSLLQKNVYELTDMAENVWMTTDKKLAESILDGYDDSYGENADFPKLNDKLRYNSDSYGIEVKEIEVDC